MSYLSRVRQLSGQCRHGMFFLLAVALAFGALYTARFGIYDDTVVRVGGLALGILLFLCRPRQHASVIRNCLDIALVIIFLAGLVRYAQIAPLLDSGLYFLAPTDVILGTGALLVLLEITRRAVGLPLVLVSVACIAYAMFGEHLGSLLQHSSVGFPSLLMTLWYSFDGVFGRPLAVVVSTILVFIIFGAVLEGLGAGDVLLKVSMRGLGWLRGGAAHAAVMASALFGTVSGSAVANVVGTGVVTIPMTKRTGFTARFAGAVETAASSGGQLMPPVMGAVAFIMADLTGIPYLYICLAALLPALFYYGSLFACVMAEAHRAGIEKPDPESLPAITRHDWMMLLVFVVPLSTIVVMLVGGYSASMAGFWAVVAAVMLGLIINPKARSLAVLKDTITRAGNAGATILVAVAAVGVVIGVMNLTGLGLRFATEAVALSEGSFLLSLILMAVACLILGMGMPTVPAYLIIILVMGPAIHALGLPTVAAHMFVVYFAVMSSLTPPVALAAFAAAPIAQSNPMGIAVTASRLALFGFLVPFAFAYSPSLLLISGFSASSLIWVVVRLVAAGYLVAAWATYGRCWALVGIVGAVCLILPNTIVQVIVLGLTVVEAVYHLRLSFLSRSSTVAKNV